MSNIHILFGGEKTPPPPPPPPPDGGALALQMTEAERQFMRAKIGLSTDTDFSAEIAEMESATAYIPGQSASAATLKYGIQTSVGDYRNIKAISEWDYNRILADAQTAITSPNNDAYTNYNKALVQSVSTSYYWSNYPNAVQHINTLRPEFRPYQQRLSYIDRKEPRPRITSNQDYADFSIMHAAFIRRLCNNDTEQIGGYTGARYAQAVRSRLINITNDQFLDFTNEARYIRNNDSMYDQNPSMFIACWCNSMLNAFDWTKDATSVYSAADTTRILNWFRDCLDFWTEMMITKLTSGRFRDYENRTYNNSVSSGYNDSPTNIIPFDGATWQKWGFSEAWSNRSTAIFRFILRAGIFLNQYNGYQTVATRAIRAGAWYFKECIAYHTDPTGSYLHDMCRNDNPSNPSFSSQKGLGYLIDMLGAMVDMADTWERNMQNTTFYQEFGSLYFYQLPVNSTEWNLFYGSGKGWENQCRNTSRLKSFSRLLTSIQSLFRFAKVENSNSLRRTQGGVPYRLNFFGTGSYLDILQMDNFMLPAASFFASPSDGFSSIDDTARRIPLNSYNLRDYNSVNRVGSYDIANGFWGNYAGLWFQYGGLNYSAANPYK